ncbi:MAG: hypothetical protein COW01_08035 [Bdellovibrionales bacterium CG12_big_fil_rev_8_21_14_0_65_38_15]|nr:MAG: hypothetical protein COW79_10755 [Bdellovibrionales bacterium CG22_combo_CG10-13_8_21_14_all_38_13]PIQ55319.1 MAG: hypothetical protein COW01_08035 [Bdellovibrionales bacterium CG12_big_fil_rev_8_21_14_0_65_38_15]
MINLMEALCNAQKVVVLGSTGLIGGHLTRMLLDLEEIDQVITIGRRSIDLEHPKLKKITIDMERLDEKGECITGASAVFCCLGTTMKNAKSKQAFRQIDFDIPLLAAKSARARGIKHFLLVSAQGASKSSPFFYSRVKGEMEAVLKQIPFDKITIARPGLLLGRKSGSRPLEDIAGSMMKLLNPLMVGSLDKYSAVNSKEVAHSLLKSFLGEKSSVSGLELIEINN